MGKLISKWWVKSEITGEENLGCKGVTNQAAIERGCRAEGLKVLTRNSKSVAILAVKYTYKNCITKLPLTSSWTGTKLVSEKHA